MSLVGANGTGKTTLIETLAGKRELPGPPAKLRIGHNVQIGYLSQHAEELAAGGARTVIEAAQRLTGLKPGPTRALLGRFLFSGEDAEKPLEGLSGGERRRLSLAILVNSGANLLILDEPTNHLDLESREALEDALRGYPGSLLLVSHDRALLDAIGSRTIELYDQDLHSYVGGWPEYLRVRGEREAKPARKREAAVTEPRRRRRQRSPPSPSGPRRRAPKPARRGGGAATARGAWSPRSRPPKRRCGRSRTSCPIRPRGRRPRPRPARPSATRPPSSSSASCTSATRPSRADAVARGPSATGSTLPDMASPRQATGVRLALIDDDSGLETVLRRRLRAIGWDASVLGHAAAPEQLAALRLHTALVNPAVTGLQYIESAVRRAAGTRGDRDQPAGAGRRSGQGAARRRRRLDDQAGPSRRAGRPDRGRAAPPPRPASCPAAEQTIVAGELEIRPDRFDAYGDGRPAGLSRKEYELLRLLAAADGQVLEREDIYQRVWGFTMARGDRSVDVFVRKLRHKLESVSPSWRYVHTHFGVGYRFAARAGRRRRPRRARRARRTGCRRDGAACSGVRYWCEQHRQARPQHRDRVRAGGDRRGRPRRRDRRRRRSAGGVGDLPGRAGLGRGDLLPGAPDLAAGARRRAAARCCTGRSRRWR